MSRVKCNYYSKNRVFVRDNSPNLGDDGGEAGGPFDISLMKETSDGKAIAELTLSPPE
jgi:hypothetical protein